MRELIREGSIPIVRDGKRILVAINDLDQRISKHKATYVWSPLFDS